MAMYDNENECFTMNSKTQKAQKDLFEDML